MDPHSQQICWDFLERLINGQFIDCESFLASLEAESRHLLNEELQRLQADFKSDASKPNSSRTPAPNEALPESLPTLPFRFSANDTEGDSAETLALTGEAAAQSLKPGGMNIEPGSQWGAYLLEAAIGKGGMGLVYLGTHMRLQRPVALKFMRDAAHASKEDLARFEREAQAAALLSHRNIVTIYEYGQYDQVPFIAMEYVAGESLAGLLRREGMLDENLAAMLLRQIASAVGYAHDNGIIHRDLKPANILMDRGGVPRVADFGLARAEIDDAGLTATGMAVGTPSYMSPEQAGAGGKEVGKPSDIYSLGAIFYECLTGVPPFRAENPHLTLMQVIEEPVVPPRARVPTISRNAESICLKCLAKLPEKRYKNAYELIADIDRLLDNRTVSARPQSLLERMQYLVSERIAIVATLIALLLTMPVFLAIVWQNDPTSSALNAHQAAVAILSQKINAEPGQASWRLMRGEHQFELGKFTEAYSDVTAAAEQGGGDATKQSLLLGKCQWQRGDQRSALASFDQVLATDPTHIEAQYWRAQSLLNSERPMEAVQQLDRVIEMHPDYKLAYQLRSRAWELAGDQRKALQDKRTAQQLGGQ